MPRKKRTPGNPHPRHNLNVIALNFSGRRETLEDIFGAKPLDPKELIRLLWIYVRLHNLKRRVIAPIRLGGSQPPPTPRPQPVDRLDDIATFRRRHPLPRRRLDTRADAWLDQIDADRA